MIDRIKFFDNIREPLFNGSLSVLQVDTIDAVLEECETQGITDNRQVAYIFATAFHEAHNPHHPNLRLTPMKEFGGDNYLKSKPYYPYFGRGLSQLTWICNYRKEGERLGLDLLNHPDLILDVNIAANSHVYCMSKGIYTGRKLSDYINANGCNFEGARKVVNGADQKVLIAGYARQFLTALL